MLERNPRLVVASRYEPEIRASLERVWENVLDWEHLPHVHAKTFAAITPLESNREGWSARVRYTAGGASSTIELRVDQERRHYVTRSLDGPGAGSEIWTRLTEVDSDTTQVAVEFCVPPLPDQSLRAVGRMYVSLYQQLWSEDEGMMRARSEALRARASTAATESPDELLLGLWPELRALLPLDVQLAGEPFRIVELDGAPFAYATRCPHQLGPLESDGADAGRAVCPWHGYAFDLRTARSCDGRKLRLSPHAEVRVDPTTRQALLRSAR